MAKLEESIEVDAPISQAYNQWTQFEEFPRFMEHIDEVRQLDDTHLHWKATFGGKTEEWDAVVTEQHPDERIAWQSTGGAKHAGVVTFHRLDDAHTKVMLQIDAEPESFIEKVGDAMGIFENEAKNDLKRFKEFIESRVAETGAWRGDVAGPHQGGNPNHN